MEYMEYMEYIGYMEHMEYMVYMVYIYGIYGIQKPELLLQGVVGQSSTTRVFSNYPSEEQRSRV